MSKEATKYLLDNDLEDIVLNAKKHPENTPENAKKWIYLSDVLDHYLALNQRLVLSKKDRYCIDCGDYVGSGCDNKDCKDFNHPLRSKH